MCERMASPAYAWGGKGGQALKVSITHQSWQVLLLRHPSSPSHQLHKQNTDAKEMPHLQHQRKLCGPTPKQVGARRSNPPA